MKNDYLDYLAHYGVEGMRWGVRRYQNEDGSLTALGREHYGIHDLSVVNKDYYMEGGNEYVNKVVKKKYKNINKIEKQTKKAIKKEYDNSTKSEAVKKREYEKALKEVTESALKAKEIVDIWAESVYGSYAYADAVHTPEYNAQIEAGRRKAEAEKAKQDKFWNTALIAGGVGLGIWLLKGMKKP